MGAIGLEPGDEVIVTLTMVATAMAILHWNAIPVFVDIDPQTFNIDPKAVENAITSDPCNAAVDIFGQSADMPAPERLQRHDLKLVSDTAQAPGASLNEFSAGTMAAIGGLSLNYHKHIHCVKVDCF